MTSELSYAGDNSVITSHSSLLHTHGVGAVSGSPFFFCFLPSSRGGGFAGALAGGPGGATRSFFGGSFFGGLDEGSTGVCCFGGSGAASGFTGSIRLRFVSG